MARWQPAVADAFRWLGGSRPHGGGDGCVGRGGLGAWQALPASRRHGSRSRDRLGVGLGGDRRVRRYLSAIADHRKPAAQAPDAGVPAGSQPAIPNSRERLLVRDGAEHRSAIQPLSGGCPDHIGREQRQRASRPCTLSYLRVHSSPTTATRESQNPLRASTGSRQPRSPASPRCGPRKRRGV